MNKKEKFFKEYDNMSDDQTRLFCHMKTVLSEMIDKISNTVEYENQNYLEIQQFVYDTLKLVYDDFIFNKDKIILWEMDPDTHEITETKYQ